MLSMSTISERRIHVGLLCNNWSFRGRIYVLDRFIVCTGLGSTGKDALLNSLLKATLGPYYYRASSTMLTQKAKSDLNVGIANMDRCQAIIFGEANATSVFQVALVKDLTGGNEINARGLYSPNTIVNLHSTTWMLCNDKPMLDKVDEAIARHLITLHFRSTFKSKEFLSDNDFKDGENNIYVGDETVKLKAFLNKHLLVFMNLLLPYYQRFKAVGYTITDIPESVRAQSRKCMQESDPLYNWFNSMYRMTSDKADMVRLKNVYAQLKHREYYLDLTKQDRCNLAYAALIEYVERSPLLRMFYKERIYINKYGYKNVLTGFTIRSADEHLE